MNNVFFRMVITCFMLITISSCNSNRDSSLPEITHLAFQNERNGNWGMIGIDGKVLFKDKINYRIDLHPSYAVNGVFRTWEFDQSERVERLKYYTATENPNPIGLLEGYKEGGVYSEGIIPVVPYDSRIHYINLQGDTVFCLNHYKGKEISMVSSFFTDHRAWFMTEDYKYGYINPKGEVVIEPIYDNISPFHNGKAIVYDKQNDKYIAIDTNGKVLFEVGANGKQTHYPFFHNGYCILGNFLYNEKGKLIQRLPSTIDFASPFKKNVALVQNQETRLWQLIDIHGNTIGNSQHDNALGMIDDFIYVGDTLAKEWEEDESKYMNVYIINKKGEICNQIKNVFRFFPIYDKIVIGENNKYYFADKNGDPITNKSFHYISVPSYTKAPGYPCLWTFMTGVPHPRQNYYFAVQTNYVDVGRTLASVLNQLTDTGIGKLKIGQKAIELMTEFNIKSMPVKGEYSLKYTIQGFKRLYAFCSVGLLPPDGEVTYIRIEFNAAMTPNYELFQDNMSNAITSYLDELGLEKVDGGEDIDFYLSPQRTYDVVNFKNKGVILLMSKFMMNKMHGLYNETFN